MSGGEAAMRRFSAFLVRTIEGPECAGTGLKIFPVLEQQLSIRGCIKNFLATFENQGLTDLRKSEISL
jgi:hypothetical protein